MIKPLLEQGVIVICAGGGGIPTAYADEPAPAGRRLRGIEAVIDKDLASALLAIEIGADALLIVTDVDAVYADWGTPSAARRSATRRPRSSKRREFAAGSMGPKVRAACWFAEQTGGFAAIGSIDDTQALLRGEAGTRIASQTAVQHGLRKDSDGDHRTGAPTTDGTADLARALDARARPGSSTSSPSAGSRARRRPRGCSATGPTASPRRRPSRAGTRSCASTGTRCRSCCWGRA